MEGLPLKRHQASAERANTRRLVAMELLLVAGLFLAYKLTRVMIGGSTSDAFVNARRILDLEGVLNLPSEVGVQRLMLESETLTRMANGYYAFVHFPLTVAFLIWLFIRHRPQYFTVRTTLALLTGMALVVHTLFPLAPGRMLGRRGFVDTAAMYGQSVYGAPEQDSLSNQFAAMPSLHFGWAVVVALGIITVTSSQLRWLWLLHPIVTLAVIVGTGNHYWLDALVAGLLLVLAYHIVAVRRMAQEPLQPRVVVGRSLPTQTPAAYDWLSDSDPPLSSSRNLGRCRAA
ncbi:MAG: phosphatase PAP2 family protein [Nocardioidaceae bacterium]